MMEWDGVACGGLGWAVMGWNGMGLGWDGV